MSVNTLLIAVLAIVGLVVAVAAVGLFRAQSRYASDRNEAERTYQAERPEKLPAFGTTKTLSILPLSDWHTSRADLIGEAGVSYLIETDHARILFDVGFNREATQPSPLEHNMAKLGVGTDRFETIVISHCHADHVGGMARSQERTFSLGNQQHDLAGKQFFAPIEMTYPGLETVVAEKPMAIAPGVATTGTIPRRLWFGNVREQALAVNVEGKGIVLIVGCGHQTMLKLIERVEDAFSAPLHGLVGGMHYPVPSGRMKFRGIDAQRRMASGDGFFHPLEEDEVRADTALSKARNPGIVAISGHDSSDEMIDLFREEFGPAYRDVKVGERITVSTPDAES